MKKMNSERRKNVHTRGDKASLEGVELQEIQL